MKSTTRQTMSSQCIEMSMPTRHNCIALLEGVDILFFNGLHFDKPAH